MKRCLACGAHFLSKTSNCPACGFGPVIVDGFSSYAPGHSHDGDGFKASYFLDLASLEEANFWFRARNRLIVWALETYCTNARSILEIGCGTGYVMSGIAGAFPDAYLNGSEIFTAGLGFAAARLPTVNFMQMDARNIPFYEEFDVIGAFDVLEHIEDDQLVLAQMRNALKPGGHVVVTVPQHAWLWSAADEYACHVRRYEAVDLHKKLKSAGFKVVRTTSFVTTLFPPMMFSRFLRKKERLESFDATAELKIAPWLNGLFYRLLRAELVLIKRGINLPFGGSRLIVARRT